VCGLIIPNLPSLEICINYRLSSAFDHIIIVNTEVYPECRRASSSKYIFISLFSCNLNQNGARLGGTCL
jgi:hypothetical protein